MNEISKFTFCHGVTYSFEQVISVTVRFVHFFMGFEVFWGKMFKCGRASAKMEKYSKIFRQ